MQPLLNINRQTAAEITLAAIIWTLLIVAIDPANRHALAPLAFPIALGGILYARTLLK